MCMQNRNTIQPQSRLPSLRFTMRTYCRTPVEKERFDLSVRQVHRKSRSATLSTAYCMAFLFSRSFCQRKMWMLAVYVRKGIWRHMDFYPSDQRFAYSFLQILPHDRHPCCSAIRFPLSGRVLDSHPLERAHGAQTQKATSLLWGVAFFLLLSTNYHQYDYWTIFILYSSTFSVR